MEGEIEIEMGMVGTGGVGSRFLGIGLEMLRNWDIEVFPRRRPVEGLRERDVDSCCLRLLSALALLDWPMMVGTGLLSIRLVSLERARVGAVTTRFWGFAWLTNVERIDESESPRGRSWRSRRVGW